MITQAIFDVFFGLVGFVVGLFPTDTAPGWVSDGAGLLADTVGMAAGLGAWIPWAAAGDVLNGIVAVALLSLAVKIVRIVASFFTAGGGSAA